MADDEAMTESAQHIARSRWPGVVAWALTLAAGLALAWLALGFLKSCTPGALMEGAGKGSAAVISSVGDLFKPTYTISPVAVLRGEDRTPKLVVYTHMADVTVPLSSGDHWYGESYSSALARNCKGQFVVPLDGMRDQDLVLAPSTSGQPARLVIIAPRPRLDAGMLVIQPETIEFQERNTGVYRMTRMFSGPDKERLTAEIRPALLKALSDPAVRQRAQDAGREFFEKRLAEALRTDLQLGRDVQVEVRWVDE